MFQPVLSNMTLFKHIEDDTANWYPRIVWFGGSTINQKPKANCESMVNHTTMVYPVNSVFL